MIARVPQPRAGAARPEAQNVRPLGHVETTLSESTSVVQLHTRQEYSVRNGAAITKNTHEVPVPPATSGLPPAAAGSQRARQRIYACKAGVRVSSHLVLLVAAPILDGGPIRRALDATLRRGSRHHRVALDGSRDALEHEQHIRVRLRPRLVVRLLLETQLLLDGRRLRRQRQLLRFRGVRGHVLHPRHRGRDRLLRLHLQRRDGRHRLSARLLSRFHLRPRGSVRITASRTRPARPSTHALELSRPPLVLVHLHLEFLAFDGQDRPLFDERVEHAPDACVVLQRSAEHDLDDVLPHSPASTSSPTSPASRRRG